LEPHRILNDAPLGTVGIDDGAGVGLDAKNLAGPPHLRLPAVDLPTAVALIAHDPTDAFRLPRRGAARLVNERDPVGVEPLRDPLEAVALGAPLVDLANVRGLLLVDLGDGMGALAFFDPDIAVAVAPALRDVSAPNARARGFTDARSDRF